ncbi:hypothetical protein YC2023_088736 [Brassica napus]
MDFDQVLKKHVLAHIRSIFFTFQNPVVAISRGNPSFSYLRVNKSLFHWTCASYQATYRNPSFVELVRHIKQQLKSGSIKRLSEPLVSPFNPPVLPFGETKSKVERFHWQHTFSYKILHFPQMNWSLVFSYRDVFNYVLFSRTKSKVERFYWQHIFSYKIHHLPQVERFYWQHTFSYKIHHLPQMNWSLVFFQLEKLYEK